MASEFGRLTARFSKKTILVVGDIMLDQFTVGKIHRISPEAPVPVLKKQSETFFLGGAANVADNLASLGAKVILCGFVGNDSRKDTIFNLMGQKKIATRSIVISKDRPTILKQRFICHGRHLLRFDDESAGNFKHEDEGRLLSAIRANIVKCDSVIMSDYNKGCFSKNTSKKIIILAKKNNKKIIADFKPVNKLLFKGVDAIAPNLKEGKEMTGLEAPEEVGRVLVQSFNADVVLTMSDKGIFVFDRNQNAKHIRSKKIKVCDVSGAGDTVTAVLALGLISDLDFESAAILANCAGNIVVQKPGTANVRIAELNQKLYPELTKIAERGSIVKPQGQEQKKFMKAIFLDRDGVINDNGPGYIHKIDDFKFLPRVIPALKKLSKTKLKIIIVTNQSGIGRGFYTEADMKKLHRWMVRELKKKNIRIDKIYHCPHGPDDGCLCRKPQIGMFTQAASDLRINLKDSWFVDDDERYVNMGRTAGVKTIKLGEKVKKEEVAPDFYAKNLLEVADIILNHDA